MFIIIDQQNNEICSGEIYSSATVFILLLHVISMNFFLKIFFFVRLINLSTQFLNLISYLLNLRIFVVRFFAFQVISKFLTVYCSFLDAVNASYRICYAYTMKIIESYRMFT